MTRQTTTFSVADLSAFARALNKALAEHQATHGAGPSHQAMLNHIARAAGHRNLQALMAEQRGNSVKGLPRPGHARRGPRSAAGAQPHRAQGAAAVRHPRPPGALAEQVQRAAPGDVGAVDAVRRPAKLRRARGERGHQGLAHLGRPCHPAARTDQRPAADAQARRVGLPQVARPARCRRTGTDGGLARAGAAARREPGPERQRYTLRKWVR